MIIIPYYSRGINNIFHTNRAEVGGKKQIYGSRLITEIEI